VRPSGEGHDWPKEVEVKDEYDPDALSVEEALYRIEADIRPIGGFEWLPIRDSLDRVLAADVRSPVNVPAHANSAMDGYAVASADLANDGVRELAIVGTAFAGRPYTGTVHAGQCARIMTGGVIPGGTDTVIRQEDVERLEGAVRIGPGHRSGQNVRPAGEDIAAGQIVLRAGHRVRPADTGLLASLGVAEVTVRRRLRVAFFSTGDELRSLGGPLGPGEIYDSNRYTLHSMLRRQGTSLIDMGVVRDQPEDVQRAFREAAAVADIVITSGGVSVGEADYVKETLERLGQVSFWKISMKPGRPLAFGRVQDALFFGLPGNPVSVMVTFYQFVLPALQRLSGELPRPRLRLRVPCVSRLRKTAGRTDFQRGVLEAGSDGRLVVRSTGPQGSGILSSMSQANCFIILPQEQGDLEPGAEVEVEPFAGLI
jgi:molybdopterin molybdotransferase